MRILIAGGTGFIGQFLVPHFLVKGHQVTVLSRSREKVHEMYNQAVTALDWNGFESHGRNILEETHLIINLAGAGIAEQRWTRARKRELIESRLRPTRLFNQFCTELGERSPPWFNASAVSVYGAQKTTAEGLPEPITEETLIDFNYYPDFAAQITRMWEQETHLAQKNGARVVNMRFASVLGKDGGALKKLLPFYKLGLGGALGNGKQPFPWISILDLARAIDFLIENNHIEGPVNFVAPEVVPQKEFAKKLGKVLNRPVFLKTPGILLELAYGELAEDLLLQGQNPQPQVLKRNHFDFTYPNLEAALAYALT